MPDTTRTVLAPGADLPPVATVPIPVDRLRHAGFNPKTPINGVYKTGLAANIEEYGFDDALKVWPDPDEPGTFVVINGNQRLTLLKEAGVNSVHCEVKEGLTLDEAKLYAAARDRSQAKYDESKLAALAASLTSRPAALTAKLLRADVPLVPPPEMPDLPSPIAPSLAAPTIPLMIGLTPEGHREVTGTIFKVKARLAREDRLRDALASLSSRAVDDLVVELALRIATR